MWTNATTSVLMVTLALGTGAICQNLTQEPQIDFEFDYCRFRGASGLVYLEIYYSIQRDDILFVSQGSGYQGSYEIETRILRGDSLLSRSSKRQISYADSLEEIGPGQRLISLESFAIIPGDYKLQVGVSDLNDERIATGETDLTIRPFAADSMMLSDIQLASHIEKVSLESGQFVKNGYQVVPNPRLVYGIESPMLYFYAEIYNLYQGSDPSQYRFRVALLDSDGEEIRVIQETMRDKPGESSVEIGGFNVISNRSGSYMVRLEVTDTATSRHISQSKRFFIYRAGERTALPGPASPHFSEIAIKSPEYGIYDQYEEEEIDNEFMGVSYLASKEDIKIFSELDLPGKREFMKTFWVSRDQDPTTLHNEYRQDYLTRLEIVNDRYSGRNKGWKTDRGRVFLVYGEPGEIERFPSDNESRSYEIWTYFEIQSGVQFVFVDLRGLGEYTLVHSTARNEFHDADWRRQLTIR